MYIAGIASFCDSFPPAVAEGRPEPVCARTFSKQCFDCEMTGNRRREIQTSEGRWKS
jgi:hypothetical protein